MISRKSDAEAAAEAGVDVGDFLASYGWGANEDRSDQRQDRERKAGRTSKQRERKKSERTKQISFRISEDNNRLLDEACKKTKRKKGILIERAILEFVARIERGEGIEW